MGTLAKSKILLADKSTNGGLVTPTPDNITTTKQSTTRKGAHSAGYTTSSLSVEAYQITGTQLFVQHPDQANNKEITKAPITVHLCQKPNRDWSIPFKKSQKCGKCSHIMTSSWSSKMTAHYRKLFASLGLLWLCDRAETEENGSWFSVPKVIIRGEYLLLNHVIKVYRRMEILLPNYWWHAVACLSVSRGWHAPMMINVKPKWRWRRNEA